MTDIKPDPIMKIAMGFMAAKHLFVANEIGLFEGVEPTGLTTFSGKPASSLRNTWAALVRTTLA